MDGNLSQFECVKVSREQRRYHRFMAGESEFEIAEKDGASVDEVRCSIQEGQKREFEQLLYQYLGLRQDAAIEKEKLKKRIRQQLANQFMEALGKLLSGARTVAEKDRKTGEVRFRKFVDPRVLAMGIEQYRRTIGLEQRPVPAVVTIDSALTNH